MVKRCFILFTSITASFANYQHMGLYPVCNKYRSAGSTLFIKKEVNNNDTIIRNGPTCRWKQWRGKQWSNNHPSFQNYKQMKWEQQGMRTRPRGLYRKRRPSSAQWERRTIKPPSIQIIHQKLKGISWQFWSSLRYHYQTKRSQVSVQAFQRESEAVGSTIIPYPWRHHISGQIPRRPYKMFRHLNKCSTLHQKARNIQSW